MNTPIKPLTKKQRDRKKRQDKNKRRMRVQLQRQADKHCILKRDAMIELLNSELEEYVEDEDDIIWSSTTSSFTSGSFTSGSDDDIYKYRNRPNKGLNKEYQTFDRKDSFRKNHQHSKGGGRAK